MTRHWRLTLALLVQVVGLTACANLNSIGRTTDLPRIGTETEGVAIHLDAKQRLVFAKAFGALCAEPSPDALSAFATALGAGVSVPQQGAGSIALALQESAASIGLRTQSIQLLRDALYRSCEAYYSRALNSAQLMELHMRFQDIMVGLLAIEQLTGAVVARQVALGGTSNATAASQLAQIESLLGPARAAETMRKEHLVQVVAERDKAKTAVATKDTELQDALAVTPLDPRRVQTLQNDRAALQSQLVIAEEKVKAAQDLTEQATAVRQQLERNRGAALTAANAAATGTGHFANAAGAVNLDTASTQAIATAVEHIVRVVIGKKRVLEQCLEILNDPTATDMKPIVPICQQIILGRG